MRRILTVCRWRLVALGGLLSLLCVAASPTASGHAGRRLMVEVVGNQLQAQGINTGASDGLPAVRPYLNSIHDHWHNVPALGTASASLPGFDVSNSATELIGHDLWLDWMGVSKWVNPPMMPTADTKVVLEPLAPGEVISIFGSSDLTSNTFGTLLLAADIPFRGARDLDLLYHINGMPTATIHLLEFRLRATQHTTGEPATIAASDTVYVLLSPDGANPMERLHHAALFLEEYVTTLPRAIPEPTGLAACLAAILLAGISWHRSWQRSPRS